jgi:hypothetical protein
LGQETSRATSDGETIMSDRSAEVVTAACPGGRAIGEAAAVRPNRAPWVGMVVLLDYIAASLAFAAAGGYLILKAYNDQQSILMWMIEETARWFYYLGLHEMPGLPEDYRTLRNFADPFFAEAYIIAMAAVHLLATAGFLALAVALGRFRPWARRAHILVAAWSILILGAYAYAYAGSSAPRVGLAVMAVFSVVPLAVLAILLTPGSASLFDEARRPGAESPPRPMARAAFRSRLLPATFLGLVVLGALATVFVASVPVAIHLKLALAPTQ